MAASKPGISSCVLYILCWFIAAYAGTPGGASIGKVQRALTLQREEARVSFLRRALAARGADSMEYAAFRCCDRFSNQVLLAMPARELLMTNREWAGAATTYFGLPSPACAAHVRRHERGG